MVTANMRNARIYVLMVSFAVVALDAVVITPLWWTWAYVCKCDGRNNKN